MTHTTLMQPHKAERPRPPDGMRYPTLVLAHTFGHEAAHLEGLLELAERLAWGNDQEVHSILSKLIVVIYPLANPDGREAAIRLWSQNPLGEDSPAAAHRAPTGYQAAHPGRQRLQHHPETATFRPRHPAPFEREQGGRHTDGRGAALGGHAGTRRTATRREPASC